MASAAGAFEFPPMHDFKPMYTRQPNGESWARQVQLWGEMVLAYCRHNRIYRLDLNEHLASPLFNNAKIGRRVSRELAVEILNALEKQGNAQWEPGQRDKARCTIVWRTPEQWATLIYDWVYEEGKSASVLTVHEMLHDAEYTSAPFYKLDPETFDRAIACLERAGRAQRFGNPGEDGEGIKFS